MRTWTGPRSRDPAPTAVPRPVLDVAVTVAARREPVADAIYTSVKAIATVGPNPQADAAPAWYKLFASATIVAALALVAAFTAGLVNRLTTQRLTPIFGRRTGVPPSMIPRRRARPRRAFDG